MQWWGRRFRLAVSPAIQKVVDPLQGMALNGDHHVKRTLTGLMQSLTAESWPLKARGHAALCHWYHES